MWSEDRTRSRAGSAFRRRGSGPAVVLLHGIPGSAQSWRPTAELLPDDLDVIVPDLLGFGGSDRPTSLEALHAQAQAAAVDALLEELGVPRATLVGHDFGGPVALSVLARRPSAVLGLGLLASNTFGDTRIPFPLSAVTWPLVGAAAARGLFSAAGLATMLRLGTGRPRLVPDRQGHLGDRRQQRAIATIFRGSLAQLGRLYGPIEEQLRAVPAPVLVGWGDRDPFLPLAQGRRTAAAVGTDLRIYPDAGHFLPVERPQDVARDITALVRTAVLP